MASDYLKEYENAYKRELSQNWLNKIQAEKVSIDDIKIIKIGSLDESLEIASFKIGFLGDYVGHVGKIVEFRNESYFIYTTNLIFEDEWDIIKTNEIILFKIASFFKKLNFKTKMFFISDVFEIKSIDISYIEVLVENLKRGCTFYSESYIDLLDKINKSKRNILNRLNDLYFVLLLKAKYKWGINDFNKFYLLNFFDPYLIDDLIDILNIIEKIKSIG